MTERTAKRRSAPEAVANDSRDSRGAGAVFQGFVRFVAAGGPLGAAVLVLGAAGAVLMLIAELSTYREIQVVTASCEELTRSSPDVAEACITTGAEQHNLALAVIAVGALLMALGAGPGGSRPAAVALGALGLVVLAIALFGDLPHTDVTGAVGRNFDQAEGKAGPAITFELIGAGLVLAAALARLLTGRREPPA